MTRLHSKIELSLLALLSFASVSRACENGDYIIANGYVANGYGQVSAAMALIAFGLQIWRTRLRLPTFVLAALFIPIYISNKGWHFQGTIGDCGNREVEEARQSMRLIWWLMVWQIVATVWFLCATAFRKKKEILVKTDE